MKYHRRIIEENIRENIGKIPVIMLTGSRQVGKTTLLRHISEHADIKPDFVSLDDPSMRFMANDDPELFLSSFKTPLVIDEFQYAPNLLNFIKMRVDSARNGAVLDGKKEPGTMYFLTGSQIFQTMQNVSESLAGRVGIWELFPYSNAEVEEKESELFIPDIERLKSRKSVKHLEATELYDRLTKGFYPELYNVNDIDQNRFYASYVRTYIERDIRSIINVRNENNFYKFISVLAAQNAQIYNASNIANDVGVDVKTIDEWLSVLINTNIIYPLYPYANNATKRVIERPKLYFTDTGLAAYLAGYTGSSVLQNSVYSGALFEDFVVMEIVKSFVNHGLDPRKYLYFFRDYEKREVDLLIIYNNKYYPVEIKKATNPGLDAIKNFSALDALKVDIDKGIVLCMANRIMPINENNFQVPIDIL